MEIKEVASFEVADLKDSGAIFREASRGIVKIRHHGERYVLMREPHLEQLMTEVADPHPKTLTDLLVGYDAKAVKAKLGFWVTSSGAISPKRRRVLSREPSAEQEAEISSVVDQERAVYAADRRR